MTKERNDLRTRRVASWSQTQEGGRSDEKAHQKKEDEKSQVETWSQTQTVGVADEKTQRKEEAKKSQVEIWSQAQRVGVADERTQCKKEAENMKVEIQDWTQKVNEKKNHHMKEAEKAREVVEEERVDEKVCHKGDTKRVKIGNYYPNPTNCGDCSFETHHENELIEHMKTHMDQVKKNTRVAYMRTYEKASFQSAATKDEKAKEVVEKEKLDEKDCHKGDTKRVKKRNYYLNPINCGDCSFETHHKDELIEHMKMHMDQVKKNTRVAHNDHENTAWRLWEDWEYAD